MKILQRTRRSHCCQHQQPSIYSWAALCLLGGALLLSGLTAPLHSASAAIPKLDLIRVALFIDTGKYNSSIPEVTLSSDKGLDIGLRGTTGIKALFATADNNPLQASLDAYRILLLEAGDAASAKALAKKLTASKENASIIVRTKQGKPVYQLVLGPYATKEAAYAAAVKAQAIPDVASSAKGYKAVVKGPLHWNGGIFASEAEAAAQAAAVGQAGFDADVAFIDSAAGAPGFAVLIEAAADAIELNSAKQQLGTALPSLALQPVDPALTYIVKQTGLDLTSETAAGTLTQLLLGGTNGKLITAPKASETIKVTERSDRTYRGIVELSRLTGKLAVINELPFEQYLTSVVSSELSKEWPLEALKAQAVAARTFALKQGVKYQIAHITDTTLDQAYKGTGADFPAAAAAVAATEGEVLTDKAGLISPLFSSNAGGLTAEPTEVWGNKVNYLKSTATPDDGAQVGKAVWYRIVLPNGDNGYIHSMYARDTGQKNAAGLPVYESTGTGIAVRPAPYVDNSGNPASFKVNIGDSFVVFDQAVESNAYSWIRGPYDGNKLKEQVNSVLTQPISGGLDSLEITSRGPSGRVLEIKANGQALKPAYPDALRSLLNNLPSTRFEIEETGRYTILGADGVIRSQTAGSSKVVVASGNGALKEAAPPQLFLLNGDHKVSIKDKDSKYMFKGTGFGHGLGMSQWGAKGYAELGYDYKKILQTYYVGVSIVKE